MFKKTTCVICLLLLLHSVNAQKIPPPAEDSLIDYDALFSELDQFFDSLTAPKSFTVISVGVSNGFFNYKTSSPTQLSTNRRLSFSPSIGYYDKDGIGISLVGSIMKEQKDFILYQVAPSISYDYLKNKAFSTGISFTHYFTKDSLSFYTSPLKNELYVYVSVRKWWMRPSISASYGRGSTTSYEQQKQYIQALRLRPGQGNNNTVVTHETVSDFNVNASVKHDFYWLHVLGNKDYVRLTPQVVFTSGTQRYGFNQSSEPYNTYQSMAKSILYNSENVSLTSKTRFQPLSLTAYIRTEYTIRSFFIQPQFLVDYYFPASNNKLSTAFGINAGVMF